MNIERISKVAERYGVRIEELISSLVPSTLALREDVAKWISGEESDVVNEYIESAIKSGLVGHAGSCICRKADKLDVCTYDYLDKVLVSFKKFGLTNEAASSVEEYSDIHSTDMDDAENEVKKILTADYSSKRIGYLKAANDCGLAEMFLFGVLFDNVSNFNTDGEYNSFMGTKDFIENIVYPSLKKHVDRYIKEDL